MIFTFLIPILFFTNLIASSIDHSEVLKNFDINEDGILEINDFNMDQTNQLDILIYTFKENRIH